MADVLRCPSCYQKLAPTDFQCPRCELLLEGQLDAPPPAPKEVSIVRALMERPSGTVSRKRPAPPLATTRPSDALDAATMEFTIPRPLAELTPRVVAGLTLTELSLTPFEAFVVCSIDGKTRGDQLRAVLGLSEVELQAVLRTLESRGAVSLEHAAPKKRMPPPPPPKTQPRMKVAASIPAAPPAPVIVEKPRKKVALPEAAPLLDEDAAQRQTDGGRVKLGDGVARKTNVLNALKQVKRNEAPAEPRPAAKDAPRSASEVAAEGALQVAIRMEQDGHIDEAVRYLERAIARSPDAAPLLNRLAIILVRDRRDFVYAERLLRRALELAPDHEVYKKNLVMVLTRAAREGSGSHRPR